MSLKKTLVETIKNYNGVCPNYVIEGVCKRLGRKISNAERRLRKSESPNIQSVKNSKGFIIGYKFIKDNQLLLL